MANSVTQEAIDFDSLSPEFTFNIGSVHARWRDLKQVLDEKRNRVYNVKCSKHNVLSFL